MKNSYSKIDFITAHVYWSIIIWIWYKNLIFRTIKGVTLKNSMLILTLTLLASTTLGIFVHRKKRSFIQIMADMIIGYGTYTAITYFEIKTKVITVIATITVLATVLYSLSLTLHCLKIKAFTIRKLKGHMVTFRRVSYSFLVTGALTILGVIGGQSLLTFGIAKSSIAPSNNSDETIANNMSMLVQLEDNTWETLSVDEKLDVLQTVANIESRYLGLPNQLTVYAANTDETLLGSYHDNSHVITISVDSLLHDSSWTVLDTVAHEAYHDYENRLVEIYDRCPESYRDLRLFKRVSYYREEFADYSDFNENYCAYYDQKCEEDAREYAEDAVYEYYYKGNTAQLPKARKCGIIGIWKDK